jgi:uncharacterized membrane protein
MKMWHQLWVVVLVFLIPAVAGAEGFIRVDEDERAARLQTGITRYERDGATVDLIGVIHIADRAYYELLNERFKAYEGVLFEMIGGEKLKDLPAPAPAEEGAAPPAEPMSGLSRVYETMARFLKLNGQAGLIDYRAENFVHADLTYEEFERLQAERGESVLGFALEAGKGQAEGARQPNMGRIVMALMSGRPERVKLELVHTLGQGDDAIGAFAGESVIITDRNRHCLEVMDRQIEAGRRNLGIFYGAAHLPDMEKRLLEQGFRRTGHEWLTAWDIPKQAADAAREMEAAEESEKEAC